MVITFEARGGIATTTPAGLRVGIVMTAGEILARIVCKFSNLFITVLSRCVVQVTRLTSGSDLEYINSDGT